MRFSFKDWNIPTWLKKGSIEFVKAALPSIIVWAQTQDPLVTIIVGGLGKLVLDIIHYYIKE